MNIPNCPVCNGERELNGSGGFSCYFCGTSTQSPKNHHAVSLGKLGGRKPGCPGKPLDPAKARAMVAARWAKYRSGKEQAK